MNFNKIQFNKSGLIAATFLSGMALMSISQLSWSAAIETDSFDADITPLNPSTSDEILLKLTNISQCTDIFNPARLIDISSKQIKILLDVIGADFIPCPPTEGSFLEFPIGSLSNNGQYTVFIYGIDGEVPLNPFDEENLIDSFNIIVSMPNNTSVPEVPAEGSIQSGIGLIRGWACDAQTIEVQFDDGTKFPVAYGTSRKDTIAICGDDNNGYGSVIAWGLLGKGTHRMKTFIDGAEVSDVKFEVGGLDDDFATGLSRTQDIQDFPISGESATIEWRESAQNFIIIEQK